MKLGQELIVNQALILLSFIPLSLNNRFCIGTKAGLMAANVWSESGIHKGLAGKGCCGAAASGCEGNAAASARMLATNPEI